MDKWSNLVLPDVDKKKLKKKQHFFYTLKNSDILDFFYIWRTNI